MLAATPVLGGVFTPHCAAIHPSRLVRGLARVVEASGVSIFEQTRVRSIAPGRVETDVGTVSAEVVLRATEGYTARARGAAAHRRAGVLADGRDRAAVGGAVGVDRARGPADVQRRPAPDHLRPAHGRRTAGVRRARGAVPLRVAHPSVVRRRAAGLRGPPHGAARDAPAAAGRGVHPPVGRLPRHRPRLGRVGGARPPHRDRLGGRVRRRRRRPPPTSPAAPSPTWSRGPTATWSPSPGSTTAAGPGSPSRCAGWASTQACAR